LKKFFFKKKERGTITQRKRHLCDPFTIHPNQI
jgi:hypothetical protein